MTKLNKLKLIGLIAVSSSVNALNKHEVFSSFHGDFLGNVYNHDMGSVFAGVDLSYFHNNGSEPGARGNIVVTFIPNILYKDIFYGIVTVRGGTALAYTKFKDNFYKKNLDILGGVGFKITDSWAVEVKGGYSYFKGGKGWLLGGSVVYTMNKYRGSVSNNEFNKLCSNFLARCRTNDTTTAPAADVTKDAANNN